MEREDGQGTAHTPTARDLDVLYRESDRLYYELARGCGLSDAAYWMLYEIVYCGGKATQRSLAQSFAYSRQTVNTAIKSLEAKGLVRLEFEELVNWYQSWVAREHGNDDFLVELELFEAPTLRFVTGRHFDIRDVHGSGQTRIYIINREADAVLYMSTSRGARNIICKARDLDPLVRELRSMLLQLSASPDVVGQHELSAADLEDELGRSVLA